MTEAAARAILRGVPYPGVLRDMIVLSLISLIASGVVFVLVR